MPWLHPHNWLGQHSRHFQCILPCLVIYSCKEQIVLFFIGPSENLELAILSISWDMVVMKVHNNTFGIRVLLNVSSCRQELEHTYETRRRGIVYRDWSNGISCVDWSGIPHWCNCTYIVTRERHRTMDTASATTPTCASYTILTASIYNC
jgi:hypothetical protein